MLRAPSPRVSRSTPPLRGRRWRRRARPRRRCTPWAATPTGGWRWEELQWRDLGRITRVRQDQLLQRKQESPHRRCWTDYRTWWVGDEAMPVGPRADTRSTCCRRSRRGVAGVGFGTCSALAVSQPYTAVLQSATAQDWTPELHLSRSALHECRPRARPAGTTTRRRGSGAGRGLPPSRPRARARAGPRARRGSRRTRSRYGTAACVCVRGGGERYGATWEGKDEVQGWDELAHGKTCCFSGSEDRWYRSVETVPKPGVMRRAQGRGGGKVVSLANVCPCLTAAGAPSACSTLDPDPSRRFLLSSCDSRRRSRRRSTSCASCWWLSTRKEGCYGREGDAGHRQGTRPAATRECRLTPCPPVRVSPSACMQLLSLRSYPTAALTN